MQLGTRALTAPTPHQVFREQGIDGETLPLLTEEHLLTTMGLKLGPALKIRAQVSAAGEGCGLRAAGCRPHPGPSLRRWPSAWAESSTWPASLWLCRCSHQPFGPRSGSLPQGSSPRPQRRPPHPMGQDPPLLARRHLSQRTGPRTPPGLCAESEGRAARAPALLCQLLPSKGSSPTAYFPLVLEAKTHFERKICDSRGQNVFPKALGVTMGPQRNQRREAALAPARPLWTWGCWEGFQRPDLRQRDLPPWGPQWAGSTVQVSVPKDTTPGISAALDTVWSFML